MHSSSKKLVYRKKSLKNNINNLLSDDELLLNKIQLYDYSTLKRLQGIKPTSIFFENKISEEAMFISELKKPKGISKKIKLNEKEQELKNSSAHNSSKNVDNINSKKRNIDIIMNNLKKYKSFIENMKFHNVSIDLLEKICPYLMHKHIPKGEFLFKENNKINIFFGVIEGKISLYTFSKNIILDNKRKFENEEIDMKNIFIFRKKDDVINEDNNKEKEYKNTKSPMKYNNKKNILKEEKEDKNKKKEEENKNNNTIINYNNKVVIEINFDNIPGFNKYLKDGYELKLLKKGDFYGLNDLLHNKQSNEINALALENTDIFYIEKEYFDKFLINPISRIDLERKNAINKLMPSIPMEILINIKPEIFGNNYILYTEYDYAFDAIYIYKGSAELKKYSLAKSKSDIYEHKNILKTISKIDEGGIAGLEICKGPNYFYEYTLVTSEPKTIIYRINIFDINRKRKTIRKNIFKFLNKLYEQQKIYLMEVQEKNKEYEEIYNISKSKEKPKINYADFFNSVFKDVNHLNKEKRNKLSKFKLKKLNLENSNNSKEKIIKKLSSQISNKALLNNYFKIFNNKKKNINNFFTIYRNKEKNSYTFSSKKSRNEEEKNISIFNSLKIYKTLSSPLKSKSQKQTIASSHENIYSSINDNINRNNKNIQMSRYIFGNKLHKSYNSYNLFFPKLSKNKSVKGKKNIYLNKAENENEKQNKFRSTDKYFYNSGFFKIPFVSLTKDNNNLIKIDEIKNLTRNTKLKNLILDKQSIY